MIDNFEILQRHMLPRWRSLQHSIAAGELSSTKHERSKLMQSGLVESARRRTESEFQRFKQAWEDTGDIYFAEELLTFAVILGREDDPSVLTAAIAIGGSPHIRDGMRIFAQEVVHGLDKGDIGRLPRVRAEIFSEIHRRKKLIRLNPRDGLRIAETALLYANLGQRRIARSLIEQALKLLPNDRYVLRAAARFFAHIGKPDIADRWLLRSPRTTHDPWLASAQMATSAAADSAPIRWKGAKLLLGNDSFSKHDKSELAAQVGTFELAGGSRRQALKLLRLGASDPTENAIAQIEWLGRKASEFKPEDFISDISFSHEAAANTAYWQSNWDESLQACENWQDLEPFSVRPAIFGSFVSSIRSTSLERGLALAELGLVSNPRDSTLLNNMAVLLAYQGKIEEAKEKLGQIVVKSGDGAEVSKIATEGLIEFRSGNVTVGTELYGKAVEKAVDSKDWLTALRAFSFLTREVSRVDPEMTKEFVTQIDSSIQTLQKRGIRVPRDVQIIREQLKTNPPRLTANKVLEGGQLDFPHFEIRD